VGRKMVKDLILELRDMGTTVFFNTHILSDVESICDHFAIIHFGKIIARERVSDLRVPLEDFFMTQITTTSEGIGNVL
jgi:ABC-2 type transport system ATP-binding protein